jgi:hypothetical protein
VENIRATRQSILAINGELRDIEQVMLYSATIHSGELADAALDLALAIHGDPDVQEKLYAENITIPMIRRDKARALSLIARRDALKSSIDRQQINIDGDLAKLSNLEGRYEYASKLISSCLFAGSAIILSFLIFKFLL